MTEGADEQPCPACGAENIDHSIDPFKAVCNTCGFVIRDEMDSVSLNWEVTNGTFHQPENRQWETECRVRNGTEQQLAEAFEAMEDFAARLTYTSEVHEEAVDIYCDAFRAGLTDGRQTASVVATCLCFASRQTGAPIPSSRIIGFDAVDQSKFRSCRLALCEELDLTVRTPAPSEYVPFVQSELEIPNEDVQQISEVLTSIEEVQRFVGMDPAGITAAGVYVCEDAYTQGDLAEVVGLSSETVRQRVSDLREVVDHV